MSLRPRRVGRGSSSPRRSSFLIVEDAPLVRLRLGFFTINQGLELDSPDRIQAGAPCLRFPKTGQRHALLPSFQFPPALPVQIGSPSSLEAAIHPPFPQPPLGGDGGAKLRRKAGPVPAAAQTPEDSAHGLAIVGARPPAFASGFQERSLFSRRQLSGHARPEPRINAAPVIKFSSVHTFIRLTTSKSCIGSGGFTGLSKDYFFPLGF